MPYYYLTYFVHINFSKFISYFLPYRANEEWKLCDNWFAWICMYIIPIIGTDIVHGHTPDIAIQDNQSTMFIHS